MDGWIKRPNGWEKIRKKIPITSIKQYDLKFKNENFDLIICLAGGINEDNKEVHDFVKERLNMTNQYYQLNKQNGCKILLMGGGTYHKPPILNDDQYVIHESTACADYLLNFDIDPRNIYREWSSYDTIANGYYAFSNYINPLGFKKVLVITSNFHMKRSKVIFDYINSLFGYKAYVYFEETDDVLNKDVLKERIEREEKSSISFKTNIVDKKKTMKEFLTWFYEEHNCYNVIGQYLQENLKNGAKGSY